MKVFISHSGERSKVLAHHIAALVKHMIQAADPWISTGIDKGSRWLPELANSLEESRFGIVCLTRDNFTRPWILFEAGALAKGLSDNVCTLLLDLDPNMVDLPLSQFQATPADDDDEVWNLIATIAKGVRATGSNLPSDADLRSIFKEYHWPRFKAEVDKLKSQSPVDSPTRSTADMLAEVLQTARAVAHQNMVLYNRQEKMLLLAKQQYEAAVGKVAPNLQTLRENESRSRLFDLPMEDETGSPNPTEHQS